MRALKDIVPTGTGPRWIAMFDFTSNWQRPIAIEQSERRPGGSPFNQEEFGLERGRNCLNLGREVLSDLREARRSSKSDRLPYERSRPTLTAIRLAN